MIYYGAAPTSDKSSFNHTMVDRSFVLPPGETLTHYGFYSDLPHAGRLKIGREISASSYDVVVDFPISHPGGGWVDFPLSPPFVVPLTGVYRPLVWCPNSGQTNRSVVVPRASKQNVNAGLGVTSGFHVDSQATISTRFTADETPPPPPPPVPDYIVSMTGQSNGRGLFAGSGATTFTTRFLELVPNCTLTLVNSAINSSRIASWQPGQPNFNNAVSDFQAQLQAGKTPGAVIWFQGEGDATECGLSIRWDEQLFAFMTGFRTAVGLPNLPFCVVELFVNPEPGVRPYWDVIQKHQRNANALHASLADIDGSTTDKPHLTGAGYEIAGRRIAETLAPAF